MGRHSPTRMRRSAWLSPEDHGDPHDTTHPSIRIFLIDCRKIDGFMLCLVSPPHAAAAFPTSSSCCRRSKSHEWEFSFRTRNWATKKFENVTLMNRIPFCGGKTVRINPRASSCSLSRCFDRRFDRSAAGGYLEVCHLIFTVTRRLRQFVFTHQAQTSSAIAITPASI